ESALSLNPSPLPRVKSPSDVPGAQAPTSGTSAASAINRSLWFNRDIPDGPQRPRAPALLPPRRFPGPGKLTHDRILPQAWWLDQSVILRPPRGESVLAGRRPC